MPNYVFVNKGMKWMGQLKTKPILYSLGYNAEWFEFESRREARGFAKALNLVFNETFKPLTIPEARKVIDQT